MKKIFILGVGAQKAGTTWLYRQLKENDCIDMGFVKEYHVFDAIFAEECAGFRNKIIDKVLNKNKNGNLGKNHLNSVNAAQLLSFIDNTDIYFDYFDYLYLRNNNVGAVGDITPSYSMLDSHAYRHIKYGLEERGFEIKVIFVMRDPVERNWSMLRMRRRRESKKGTVHSITENDALRNMYKNTNFRLRTLYNRTILELEKVFCRSNIFLGLYEELLFSEESYNNLISFLEVDMRRPDFELKVSVSPKNESITPDVEAEIANYYRDVYTFVSERTDGRSNELWPGYRHLG